MEPEGPLSYSQEPANRLHPKSDQSNPYAPSYFFRINFNIVIFA
jgi:hypothetical protein